MKLSFGAFEKLKSEIKKSIHFILSARGTQNMKLEYLKQIDYLLMLVHSDSSFLGVLAKDFH